MIKNISENFHIYDDRSSEDSINLKKADIIYIDSDVCLVKHESEWANPHILIDLKSREVLSKDYMFFYAEFNKSIKE
jgi:hypothetical protein